MKPGASVHVLRDTMGRCCSPAGFRARQRSFIPESAAGRQMPAGLCGVANPRPDGSTMPSLERPADHCILCCIDSAMTKHDPVLSLFVCKSDQLLSSFELTRHWPGYIH